MASVSDVAARRAALQAQLDEAQEALHRAASAAALKHDPLADQMHALAGMLGALGEVYQATEDAQLEIAAQLRRGADAVADEAIDRVHASGVGIIEQLAPRLAVLVEQTTRAKQRTLRLRTVLGGIAGILVGAALIAGVSFAQGYGSGRAQGDVEGHTIAAAMAAGPEAAATWSMLMANNDPVRALAACKQSVSTDSHGRRYCSMPVWLDPPSVPNGK